MKARWASSPIIAAESKLTTKAAPNYRALKAPPIYDETEKDDRDRLKLHFQMIGASFSSRPSRLPGLGINAKRQMVEESKKEKEELFSSLFYL
jgi:hypothetical protein